MFSDPVIFSRDTGSSGTRVLLSLLSSVAADSPLSLGVCLPSLCSGAKALMSQLSFQARCPTLVL